MWKHEPTNAGPLLLLVVLCAVLLMCYSPAVGASIMAYLAIGGLVAAAAIVVYVIYWHVRNRLSPITRVRARVLRKRFKDWDISLPGETPEMIAARLGMMGRDPETAAKAYNRSAMSPDVRDLTLAAGQDYFMTFAFAGREEEFAVPESTFQNIPEGTEGLLVYRGEMFVDFHLKSGGSLAPI